ncbi:hypothetical protein [Blastopirellula retiformator]|uniref:Uncharacterized protein n=1 Tax=Blastopirellula retiformator TaxID=2527970 RepID=A0A5C5UYH6_9BACT|nr:hypothetical protein [Blastopirellula retiformator]TWT30710.1 hypothetical protein Enr8_42330 [Blastopirellula retiformator]
MTAFTPKANLAMKAWKTVAEYFTHFLVDPVELVVTGTDANAAITIKDAAGGGYGVLTSGGDSVGDNDGVILKTPGEIFKFDDNGFAIRSQIAFTPSGGNVDNIMPVGVMSGVTHLTFLGDDGAGPPADYWGAAIYKVDGGTTWICEVSNGTNQQTLDTGIAADGTEATFEIEYKPAVGAPAYGEVAFRINGELIRQPGTFAREHFKPEFSLTSATEMLGLIGVKCGSAAEKSIDINAFGFAIGLDN